MEFEKSITYLLWIGTFVMVSLAIMVFLLTYFYQKKVQKIKSKESKRLLYASLQSEELERKRIASDLHDGVLGDLNAIRNFIAVFSQTETHKNQTLLQEIKSSLDTTVINIQNINYNLMPPLLLKDGLKETLQSHIKRIELFEECLIIFEMKQMSDVVISSNYNYELYRIIQELISNSIKHGYAKKIILKILTREKGLRIEFEDDGASFDFMKMLKSSSGMGLKNISSRVKYLDGSLQQLIVDKGNKFQINFNL